MMFISSLPAVLVIRSTTPDSFIRLPIIRQPTRMAASGNVSETMMVTMMGKRIFSVLETLARCRHDDLTLLFGGQEPHDGRLDDRHQGHVTVGRHRNGTQQMGRQTGGDKDGRGTVGTADDADGGSFLVGEAQDLWHR